MNAMSIASKLVSLVLAGSVFLLLFKQVKVMKKYGMVSILYILVSAILLATPTLLLLFKSGTGDATFLMGAQVIILLMGIAHILLSPQTLPWYHEQKFTIQLMFLLGILLLAYFFTDLSLSLIVQPELRMIWFLSLLWFLIPPMLNQTVNLYLKVPQREFKQWYYPLDQRVDDPTDEELKDPLVINLLFRKNAHSKEVTSFKAKAPAGMELGRLFYFFINDYNERHPESQISVVDQEGQTHGWVFMKIGNKLFGTKKAVDPENSIVRNNIKENDELICNRIK
jgi:hypothetical protein